MYYYTFSLLAAVFSLAVANDERSVFGMQDAGNESTTLEPTSEVPPTEEPGGNGAVLTVSPILVVLIVGACVLLFCYRKKSTNQDQGFEVFQNEEENNQPPKRRRWRNRRFFGRRNQNFNAHQNAPAQQIIIQQTVHVPCQAAPPPEPSFPNPPPAYTDAPFNSTRHPNVGAPHMQFVPPVYERY